MRCVVDSGDRRRGTREGGAGFITATIERCRRLPSALLGPPFRSRLLHPPYDSDGRQLDTAIDSALGPLDSTSPSLCWSRSDKRGTELWRGFAFPIKSLSQPTRSLFTPRTSKERPLTAFSSLDARTKPQARLCPLSRAMSIVSAPSGLSRLSDVLTPCVDTVQVILYDGRVIVVGRCSFSPSLQQYHATRRV